VAVSPLEKEAGDGEGEGEKEVLGAGLEEFKRVENDKEGY
jgi:hypothetical protein